jgi:hypothetical protein
VILIIDVWRSALQLFTVGNRQELVIYGRKPSAAGQAGPGSTDSRGPHEPSWLDYRRTFYIYIANRKSQMLFVGKWELELALWATEYLTPHRYLRFPTVSPSVRISPLITVMWRRRHLSTVINGAICDWRRICTTLILIHQMHKVSFRCWRLAQQLIGAIHSSILIHQMHRVSFRCWRLEQRLIGAIHSSILIHQMHRVSFRCWRLEHRLIGAIHSWVVQYAFLGARVR